MSGNSRNLIGSLILLSLFFVFPEYSTWKSDTGHSLVVLLLGASGILLSRIFILSSRSSDRTGIEPSILAFIASWGCYLPIYPVVAVFSAAGSMINSMRSERPVKQSIATALFQGFSFVFLLRLGGFLYRILSSGLEAQSAVTTYAALTVTAMVITILRTISVRYTGGRAGSFGKNLKRNLISNGFILLLAVPGTLAVKNHPNTVEMLVKLALSLFAMITVHGISISLNRSAHERTGELETVLKLKELSQLLLTAESETEVLRTLSRSISGAWQCRSAVKWKNLQFFEGKPWDYRNGVSFVHPDGLTVSVDSFSSTVPDYLESFAERAVPVLSGLEAEKNMEKASWKSVETMISFLEGNESDFAGLSRRAAATAEKLCSALGKNSWFRNCVRLAGLLHTLEMPEGRPEDSSDQTLALPDITYRALNFMHEHWCGTGPREIQGEAIPLCARILAVSIGWEKALQSGTETAVRDLNMKAGTLYDPRLVEQLLQIKE